MIRVGLKGLRIAQLKKDNDASMTEENTPQIEYGEIKTLPNVQSLDLSPVTQSTNVDSDDSSDVLTQCTGYSGSITRNSFSPEEQALVLGEQVVNGVNVSTDTDEAPYFAIGFKTLLAGEDAEGRYLYMWVLKGKFSQGNISAQSKGNESLNPQADTLNITSTNRRADGAWRFYKRSNDPNEDATFFSTEFLNSILAGRVSVDSGDATE